MQLRKTWMLAVLSAMGMMMTACDGGGRADLTCAADLDCLDSEICHPNAKVCVQTCTLAADCPGSAKNCDPISATNTTKVCQCVTDALCATDERVSDTTLTCSTAYKVCVPPGSTPAKCTKDADCATTETCEVSTGACKPKTVGTSCTGEGRSTCSYGEYCGSSKCAVVPAPTCPNFDGKPAKDFTPATGTGNIIYSVAKEIFGAPCGSDTANQTVKARVSFYSKDGTLPAEKEGLSGFFYVRTGGTSLDGVPLSTGYVRASDGKTAALSVNLCTDASFNQIVLGFTFTGGNGYCATFTK